jgi:ATP-dependent RNA helicase DeaD
VHRIGRVGRAGREGVAITLAEPREQRQLQNIERLTKQQIEIGTVPTVADLRATRIAQTTEAVREALNADDLHDFHDVLEALSGEHNVRTIALAAIKLAHEAVGGPADEVEIPDVSKRFERNRDERADRGHRPDKGRPGRDPNQKLPSGNDGPTGYLFIGLGRRGGVRPGDLVGAIANESGLTGRQIGPIRISDAYSVVGVPEHRVDDIIDTMRSTLIRGKKTTVRRYTD